MSPIGRIFIVLNLVLAVAFLGWASSALASSQDWKGRFTAEAQAHSDDNDRLTDEVSAERLAKEGAQSSLDQLQSAFDAKDASNTQLQTNLDDNKARFSDLQASFTSMSDSLDSYVGRNDELTTSVENLTSQLTAANDTKNDVTNERDGLQSDKNDLERQLTEANNAIAALERVRESLNGDIRERDTLIATAQEVFGVQLSELLNMPQISGAVLMVSEEVAPGFVAINRGAADNVQRGFTFEVYSGGQYKGTVRVVDVQANQCFAIVEKTYDGRKIEQGDSAATHI